MATNTEKIIVQVEVKGQKDLQSLEKGSKNTTMAVGNMSKGLGKAALAVTAAVASFKVMTSVIGGAIKSFRDFEFQMAKVRAVSGANTEQMRELTSTAQELGRTTFFTATQVAELQTNFAKLGFTSEEIMNAQQATLDLATATGSDLARSATVAGATIRGFGLDASETGRVVDVMAKAFTSSALDLEKFQTSMTKVAPIAKSAGFSLEDTVAIMSKLTDAGIEASIAGTSLRNILLKMQDPNSDLVKSFGKTIHSFDELLPAMKKFTEEGGSLAEIMEVVDLRQAAAFEQMLTSADSTEILRNELLNANGAASEMAHIVGDNMEGAFKRLTSALEGLAIAITDSFVGKAITGLIEGFTGVVTKINEFVDGQEEVKKKTKETKPILMDEVKDLRRLQTEYTTLTQKTHLNAQERVRLNDIISDMHTRFGDSIVQIDEETGALVLNEEAVDALIAKKALLADKEALKILHQIRKEEKAIKKENETLEILNKNLDNHKKKVQEVSKFENERRVKARNDEAEQIAKALGLEKEVKTNEDLIHQQKLQGLVRSKTIEQQNAINKGQILTLHTIEEKDKVQKKVIEQERVINGLEFKKSELQEKLNKLGFDAADIERLMVNDLTPKKINRQKNELTVLKDLNDEKRVGLDLDALLLDFQEDLMMQGLLNEEEMANVRKQLIQEEIKDIDSELNFMMLSEEKRAELLKQRYRLEKQLRDDNDKEKDRSLEEDIVRAALSGQNAMESVKSVIRAQIMEAVATQIKQIIKSVPFPFNLAISAGAGLMVGRLVDSAMGSIPEFARGGMVHGKSHANGGEKFAVGGRVVELEGGEAVINKRSTAMFRSQLSAINSAGGGVKFADGGLLNNPSFTQQQFSALGQSNLMGAMNGASKVVVVESDITDAQRSVSVIEADATI